MFAKHYSKYYDLFNKDKPYKREINFVHKWAEKPRRILDIGCGTAKYWKYYPEGTHITGIERSQNMIDQAPYYMSILCSEIGRNHDFSKLKGRYDAATALFDVVAYMENHSWWKDMPIKTGGYFIFDIWDKEKVDKEGFSTTLFRSSGVTRRIIPFGYDGKSVKLAIEFTEGDIIFNERHKMFVYSHEDIERFCGKEFDIVEVKKHKTKWQTWYKLIRK